MLSEKYLISMCSAMHVRTWTLTRFRGRISTQPGSTPHASFRIVKLDDDIDDLDRTEERADGDRPLASSSASPAVAHDCQVGRKDVGPFGDQDDGDKQVFIERFRSQTNHANVLTASNGQKICELRSVDGSLITSYCVHECEAVAMGNRSRRYILTGHENGHVQVWDLTTAMELSTTKMSPNASNAFISRHELLKELLK